MDQQPRLTDLIPRRLSTFFLWLVAGVLVVAALEGLYAWMPSVAHWTTDGRVAAFDLDSEGSLGVWFSSMTLAAAGLVAIVIYLVRRHRQDDYTGRYRIWLWAATCWFVLSVDETASLHEGFKEMMAHLSGTRLFGDGSIWWVMAYVFVLGGVGSRLVLDMRPCWLSMTAIAATAGCYVVAVATQLGWLLPDSGARGVMLEEGAEMMGNVFLLLAMGLHARYVIMDAEGKLPERHGRWLRPFRLGNGARGKRASGGAQQAGAEGQDDRIDAGAADGAEQLKVHPPGSKNSAASDPVPAASATGQSSGGDGPQESSPVRRKLTKAEKKALRRKLRKMALQRQKQAGR